MPTVNEGLGERPRHLRLVSDRQGLARDNDLQDALDEGDGCVGMTLVVIVALGGLFWAGVAAFAFLLVA